MLKSFALQLAERLPAGKRVLEDLAVHRNLADLTAVELRNAIRECVEASQSRVLALVDGLDEYSRDLAKLVCSLITLANYAGLKMCLASRPKTDLINALEKYPTIVMQDFKRHSIASCVDEKIKFRQQYFKAPFPENLKSTITENARGVILWASLAVDDLVQGCEEGRSQDQLQKKLDSLPEEVTGIYERVLNNLDSDETCEAALILHLLRDARGSIALEQLFGLYIFMTSRDAKFPAWIRNLEFSAFRLRLTSIFKGLIDILPAKYKHQTESVRVTHKTLQTFIVQSNWVCDNLSEGMRNICPNSPRLRAHVLAIEDASHEPLKSQTELNNDLDGIRDKGIKVDWFLRHNEWRPWSAVLNLGSLYFDGGLDQLMKLAQEHEVEHCDSSYEIIQKATETDLFHLYCRHRLLSCVGEGSTSDKLVEFTCQRKPHLLHLLLAAFMGLIGYIRDQVTLAREGLNQEYKETTLLFALILWGRKRT